MRGKHTRKFPVYQMIPNSKLGRPWSDHVRLENAKSTAYHYCQCGHPRAAHNGGVCMVKGCEGCNEFREMAS